MAPGYAPTGAKDPAGRQVAALRFGQVGGRVAWAAAVALLVVVALVAGVMLALRSGRAIPFVPQRPAAAATEKPPRGPVDPNGVPLSYWPDACQLVSSGEVSQTFGGAELLPPQPGSGRIGTQTLPLPTACEHQSTDYRLGATVDVTVMSVSKTATQAAHLFSAGKTVGDTAPIAVAGIGQQAVGYGGAMAQVRVQQRRVVFQVGVTLAGSQTADAADRQQRQLDAAESLARIAAGRIP
jgi:hypothetical protein